MRTWIKLYTEIVSDPKIGRLTDRQFRTCINLFAIAGIEDNGGVLPNISDLTWRLRIKEDALNNDMQALARVGILKKSGDTWTVAKFDTRQAKPPSASKDAVRERVQRHRAKHGNDDVTTLHANGNALEEEVEVEVEVELEEEVEVEVEKKKKDDFDPAFARALRAFENDISMISGSIAPDIADMWDLLTTNGVSDWWFTAIEIAVASNKRSWSYVRGILQNCLTQGRAPVPRGNGHSNGKSEERPYRIVEDVDEAGRPIVRKEYLP